MTSKGDQNERVDLIELTPERARDLLGFAGPNRTLNPRVVQRYSEAILRGEWQLSNDAIALDAAGLLTNGQHRCAAVLLADQPIDVLLVRGIDDTAQEVIDTGRTRQLHDVLTIRGEKNATSLASACAWLWKYEQGKMRHAGMATPTHRQLLEVLDRNPALRDAVVEVRRLRVTVRVATGLFGMLLYVFDQIDSEDADAFLTRLATGVDLHEDDPILRLRNVLIAELSALRKTQPWRLAALTVKAWNAYRDGERVRQLRFRAGGAAPETFPEPH